MIVQSHFHDEDFTNRALEVSIHVGLLILLAAACFVILRPFIPLIVWGIIVAIAVYPGYRKLKDVMRGRGGLAAVLCTIVLLAILFVPVALLTETLIEGIQSMAAHVKDGTLTVPPPPPNLETWPIIGVPLSRAWNLASTNLTAALRSFAPQIKAILPRLLSASAGIGLTVLQFVLSILISGGLLAYAQSGAEVAGSLADRLFGVRGTGIPRTGGIHDPQRHDRHSRGCVPPIDLRGGRFSRGGTAWRRLVGASLPIRRCASGGPHCPRSRRYLYLYDREHYQGSSVLGLVHHRRPDGQCAEAHTAWAWSRGTHRCGFHRRDWGIHGNGHYWPIRRCHCSVGRIQADPRLACSIEHIAVRC